MHNKKKNCTTTASLFSEGASKHLQHLQQTMVSYVETDPSGRYGRFKDMLGKGAMKTVYRAFDEVLGMEVAWNQVNLNDVFRSPDDLQRLYSEVHLLKNLDHQSIIRFHFSWIDTHRRNFNFITEMFASGTLRDYRKKYQRVDIGAIKNWSRQIVNGLVYLHGHDPPVIHRDLKCDNIFVNGHLGQVKIGDLGLAAILQGSQHAYSVIGTPEFMAPELYEEEYTELVDIYSFGMCVIEMLTGEYPYSECSNPAQIYKKVTSGKLPQAFYRIEDEEARAFIGKCLAPAAERLPASKLLLDPFLAVDKEVPIHGQTEDVITSLLSDSTKNTTDMTITGTMNQDDDDTIFLKVQISDKSGHTRNVHFPFDVMNDTAIDVAMEMVKELEITDLEPLDIADMIEAETRSLIPSWTQVDDHRRQQSFIYDEDGTDHPFHSASSPPSPSGFNYLRSLNCQHWLQGETFMSDDANSQSSMGSFKYSSYNYYSSNEEENNELSPRTELPPNLHKSTTTRFCPTTLSSKQHEWKQQDGCSNSNTLANPHRNLSRIRSLMDVRSQLLHHSLLEMIRKRRLFKTVGAVENIGYHDPFFASDVVHDYENRRFKW